MKKIRIWNIVCAVLWVIQLAAEAAAFSAAAWLNMLPVKYLAALAGILAGLWLIVGAVMLLRRKQGKYESHKKDSPCLARRIIGVILSVVVTAACAAVSVILWDVQNTVSDIAGDSQIDGVTMAVYVLAGDPAESIRDAAEYTFAVVGGYESERTEILVNRICEELDEEPAVSRFASITAMIDSFYDGEIGAVILNSAYVELLEDEELYTDFSEKSRILYSMVVSDRDLEALMAEQTISTETESAEETEGISEKGITGKPFIVYVSGSDTRSNYLTTSRSDVNILMVVNPVTKQVLLVNTPRDYYIDFPSGNGAKDKLTHCGMYGISCSIEALETLYHTSVDYYGQINFTGFKTLIDAIDGIEVYSDVAFSSSVTSHSFSEGYNNLNGSQALAFARERKHLPGGDNSRGKNQMKVITAVIQKLTSGTTIITNYSAIMDSIEGMFQTDLTTRDISDLVKMQLDDMASWNIMSYAVTGVGGSGKTYSMPGVYSYVMFPDQSTVDYGRHLIECVLVGQTLSGEDLTCPEGYVYEPTIPSIEESTETQREPDIDRDLVVYE